MGKGTLKRAHRGRRNPADVLHSDESTAPAVTLSIRRTSSAPLSDKRAYTLANAGSKA